MVNYQLGKIYKLIDNTCDKVYIGSTCEKALSRRLATHKVDYKRFLDGTSNRRLTAFEILQNNNYDIILIEDYPCERKEQLHARERYWIENTICVNKHIPTRTNSEWQKDNFEKRQEQHKVWNENNRERVKENAKKYEERNKERRREQHRIWYQNNKERIIKQQVEYKRRKRQENKIQQNIES